MPICLRQETVALKPSSTLLNSPKMLVKEGDLVKAGTATISSIKTRGG